MRVCRGGGRQNDKKQKSFIERQGNRGESDIEQVGKGEGGVPSNSTRFLGQSLSLISFFFFFRKLEQAVAVRNSRLERFSRQISTLLENHSPISRQREMLSLPRFGHFPARKTAAGK